MAIGMMLYFWSWERLVIINELLTLRCLLVDSVGVLQ
jgi:hypothetical protein